MDALVAEAISWPYLSSLSRLGLALALGVIVGLEREWRRKEAGFRTYGLTSVLGCIGAMLGTPFALASLALIALLVIALNLQTLLVSHRVKLATSASLFVMGFVGILCGKGHMLTPTAIGIITAALLAWKKPIAHFSIGLSEAEVRSAILIAILALVVYPALPVGTVDPWQLLSPRSAWSTVILIAGIGFVNYILLKTYGKHGVELTGFLGGLVNSTVTVVEMARKVSRDSSAVGVAYNGVILATGAMLIRNAVLLLILAPKTVVAAFPSLAVMLTLSCMALLLSWRKGGSTAVATTAAAPLNSPPSDAEALPIESPFSLRSTLKFGLIFLLLQATGIVAQRASGQLGFYGVSLVGGLISSSSAVASAGQLAAHGALGSDVAGTGAVLATLASVLVNLPLVSRLSKGSALFPRLAKSLSVILGAGLLTLIATQVVLAHAAP